MAGARPTSRRDDATLRRKRCNQYDFSHIQPLNLRIILPARFREPHA